MPILFFMMGSIVSWLLTLLYRTYVSSGSAKKRPLPASAAPVSAVLPAPPAVEKPTTEIRQTTQMDDKKATAAGATVAEEKPIVRIRSLSVKRSSPKHRRGPSGQLEQLKKLYDSRTNVKRRASSKSSPYPSYRLQEMTQEELDTIEVFKKRLAEEGIKRPTQSHASSDGFIGRFIRGKHGDHEKAYQQLTACLKFREERKLNSLLQWYRAGEHKEIAERIDAYYPWEYHGVDHNGIPVTWDRMCTMDFRLLCELFSLEELVLWHFERLEIQAERCQELGIFGGVFIEDFIGLSKDHWYKPAVDFLKTMMNVDQANYPEFSTSIFYANSPKILAVLWPLIRPLMDPYTVNKVHISSGIDLDGLLELMPASSVPVEYGGSCTSCGGDQCLSQTLGGSHYGLVDVQVGPRSHVDVEVKVEEASARVAWNFKCPSDINMHIVRKSDDAVLHSVELSTEKDGVIELNEGHYAFRYDNTFSYWSAKLVGHNHRIILSE